MKKVSCDTLIIGAGTAGLCAYNAAIENGSSCIIVESGPLGTTSQRTGDVPTSLLLSAGFCAHEIENLCKFGINLSGVNVLDTKDVMNSLRAMRARGTTEILSMIYKIPEEHRYIGKASFIDEHTLEIKDNKTQIEFKSAVIATGAVPAIPYEIGKLGGVLTTQDIFDLDELPKSMAVFGSGAVALQLGQALSYLGCEVVVFANHNIWSLTDENVIQVAKEQLSDRFNIVFNSSISAIDKEVDGYGIYYLDDSNYENYLKVDKVLAANARQSCIEGLNLRQIGVSLNNKGFINVDPHTMQTSLKHIFAAGDVCSFSMSTLKAKKQGRIAGTNASLYPIIKVNKEHVPISIIFTEPQMAVVGNSLDIMRKRASEGLPFVSAEYRTNDGLFRIKRKIGGIVRLYVDENSHMVMGAEICSAGADSMAQFLHLAIEKHMTVEELASFDFFHPTYEEALGKVAHVALKSLLRKDDSVGTE